MMTEWLIAKLIPDYENTSDLKVRLAYGNLSGGIGLACNAVLFLLKAFAGIATGSAAIMSDSVNNLSDGLNCLVTLIGYRVASKPADREHPFGHGRLEYMISFVTAEAIFLFALELLKTGAERILKPEPVTFSAAAVLILALSMIVKYGMYRINTKLGKKIGSTVMITAARDSVGDVLTTGGTLASLILSRYSSSIPFDGIAACAVALIILKTSIELFQDLFSRMIGKKADYENASRIREILLAHPEISGAHDLILHDYGPGRMMGTVHAEMDSSLSLVEAHAVIDAAEREIQEELHISVTIHPDPKEPGNRKLLSFERAIVKCLTEYDPAFTIHDLRYSKEEHLLSFDVLIPESWDKDTAEINKSLEEDLCRNWPGLKLNVVFDYAFAEEKKDEE